MTQPRAVTGVAATPEANASGAAPLVRAKGVTLQYKTPDHLVTATYRVSFDIFPAERYVILGPSGCGKSTILKAIAGFIKPVEGEILLKSRPVTGPGPDRLMVFQEFDQLLPWQIVLGNVMFPMIENRIPRDEAKRRAREAIAKVNLADFIDVFPHMLSGGMKQRCAIARAMAMKPDVLMMDEPYAALDALTRRKMQDELLQLWDDIRFTLVFVIVNSVLWAVALNTHAGCMAVSETLRMAGQTFGLKGLRYVVKILMPAAFPAILAGLKIGWAFAWRTLIAAELVFGVSSGSGGLGWYIFENRNLLDTANVFAGLLTVMAVGLLVEGVIFRTIEIKTIRRWGMQH